MPDPIFFKPPHSIKRQLSVAYIDPYSGRLTQDDPASYKDKVVREALEDALVGTAPWSGYAKGILKHRASAETGLPTQDDVKPSLRLG